MATALRIDPQPLPAVQRYFQASLYLLVASGVLAVVSTGKLDLVATLLPPAALIYKGIRMRRGRSPEISARAASGLVLAYFVFFPFDLWVFSHNLAAGSPNPGLYAGLLSAIHLLLFATLVRLFSAQSNRDYIFLAVLAFTSMLAAAILTVDTSFLIALAAFLVFAVSTFAAMEIRHSAAGAVAAPLEASTPAAQQLQRALGVTSTIVALGTLALGGAIFFLIPRFTAGYLSALNLQPTLMSGFSENVQLGEIGEIKKSGAVVMRIRVEGHPAQMEMMHWRGIALTSFDGTRWSAPARGSMIVSMAADDAYHLLPPRFPPGDFVPLRYSVLMEPLATSALFLAPMPTEVRGQFGEAAGLGEAAARGYLVQDRTGSVFRPAQNGAKMLYEAVSAFPLVPVAQLRAASIDYPADVREVYLQLPPLDPRIPPLAAEITAHAASPYDKAANLERYLQTRYGYTLDLSGPPVRDPLAYFLFERRAGHCEYFATAMVVMLRTLGIPSRYVTGFLPGEYNSVAGDYIVRASDAHSWVEAYFPGYGWMTFDPTPPGAARTAGLFSDLAHYWDWFQYTWGEWVINYDIGHQLTLAHGIQHSTRDWKETARRFYQSRRRVFLTWLQHTQTRMARSRYALPGVLILAALLFFVLRFQEARTWLTRWSLRARYPHAASAALATLEYQQMLRLLERRGWCKPPGQTALEFAAAIPAPEIAAPVARLTEMYQSARFGTQIVDAIAMSTLLATVKSLLRAGAFSSPRN